MENNTYRTNADVIIIGAGGAGLTAAFTAYEGGKSVILLEKDQKVGGNTLCAHMGINAAGVDVQEANPEYVEAEAGVEGLEALQLNNERAHKELVKVFAENSGKMAALYQRLGVEFKSMVSRDPRNKTANYYMLLSKGGKTATVMVNAIYEAIQKTDIALYTGMDAREILTDVDGNVCGIRAVDEQGEEICFEASKVILCTGGFGQNRAYVAKVAPRLANAITDEMAPTSGDGIFMAEALGAQAVDLDQIQTFPHVIDKFGMVNPGILPGGFRTSAVYVNADAKRFTKEGFEIVEAALAQKDGAIYSIFSEADCNNNLKKMAADGWIFEADSAKELAGRLGLDSDALEETVKEWNAACAAGEDKDFGNDVLHPLTGKLYGYRFGIGVHFCCGGILINEKTHVLKADGSPIPGLYAAGEVTGGFHGTRRVDGSGTGDAFAFGYIAGKQMLA